MAQLPPCVVCVWATPPSASRTNNCCCCSDERPPSSARLSVMVLAAGQPPLGSTRRPRPVACGVVWNGGRSDQWWAVCVRQSRWPPRAEEAGAGTALLLLATIVPGASTRALTDECSSEQKEVEAPCSWILFVILFFVKKKHTHDRSTTCVSMHPVIEQAKSATICPKTFLVRAQASGGRRRRRRCNGHLHHIIGRSDHIHTITATTQTNSPHAMSPPPQHQSKSTGR